MKKQIVFSVLVLFVLIGQIDSYSIAVAGEKTSADLNKRQTKLLSKCNGVIFDYQSEEEFHGNFNPYADKGKCTEIEAVSFQITSATTGLFNISNSTADLVYIEFKAPFRGRFVEGVAKIKGVYTYRTKSGGSNTVPRLEMIEIKKK